MDQKPEDGKEFFGKLLEHIIGEGRHVPKFQVERAIAPILDFFVEDVVSVLLDGDDVVKLGAEFPLKKENYQSTNIDWLMFNSRKCELIFFELKTERSSVNPKQLEIYRIWTEDWKAANQAAPWERLESGLTKIEPKSRYREKYKKVIERLEKSAKSCGDGLKCAPVRIVYLAPPDCIPAAAKGASVESFSFADLNKKLRENTTRNWSTVPEFRPYLTQLCKHLEELDKPWSGPGGLCRAPSAQNQ